MAASRSLWKIQQHSPVVGISETTRLRFIAALCAEFLVEREQCEPVRSIGVAAGREIFAAHPTSRLIQADGCMHPPPCLQKQSLRPSAPGAPMLDEHRGDLPPAIDALQLDLAAGRSLAEMNYGRWAGLMD